MNPKMNDKGLLMVVSGPSGAGKSTVIKMLLARERLMGRPLLFSVSVTTRPPRPGERDGEDYHFISDREFDALMQGDGLLEYAEYAGCRYGTPRAAVEERLRGGACVLLDVEVQGALQVKSRCPEAVLVFMMPPSFSELERRLRNRRSETEEVILRRLSIAKEEYGRVGEYNYIVFNHAVNEAADRLAAIIQAECSRVSRQVNFLEEV